MKKTIVIVLDGMDKELIDEFDLEHIKQEEYDQIDSQNGRAEISNHGVKISKINMVRGRLNGAQ